MLLFWRKTISEVLSEMAARPLNHEAHVGRHQNARLAYGQLHRRVEAVARGLSGLGLKAGERIGVWASKLPRTKQTTLVFVAPADSTHQSH